MKALIIAIVTMSASNGAMGTDCTAITGLPDFEQCNLATLPPLLSAADEACCLGLSNSSSLLAKCTVPEGMAYSCDTNCAMRLLPLVDGNCYGTLSLLYDARDEKRDGVASIIDAAAQVCRAISPATVIAEIAELQSDGNCAKRGVSLDGLAETQVDVAACFDVFPCQDDTVPDCSAKWCNQMISASIMTCQADFCQGPSCSFTAQCDASCGLCGETSSTTGGKKGKPALGGGKRLLQASAACDLDTIAAAQRRQIALPRTAAMGQLMDAAI
jgi:hypothetical protein